MCLLRSSSGSYSTSCKSHSPSLTSLKVQPVPYYLISSATRYVIDTHLVSCLIRFDYVLLNVLVLVQFLSYLLATGTAAGFGLSVDLQTLDPDDYFGTFFDKAYAASALLLFAFFCSAAVSIISSFALSKRP